MCHMPRKTRSGPKRIRSAVEPVMMAAVMMAKVAWKRQKSDSGRVAFGTGVLMPVSHSLVPPPRYKFLVVVAVTNCSQSDTSVICIVSQVSWGPKAML